jgi:hypothetical protein
MPPLSSLIRDPFVRRAFERAERDFGQACGVPVDRPRGLTGGAQARPEPDSTDPRNAVLEAVA